MRFSIIPAILALSINALSQVPVNGLVGHWPFNGNANDESLTGNNATVIGATLTTDRFGINNRAYGFDGGDRIQAPENPAYDFGSGNFSIFSWVNITSFGTSRIVSAGYDENNNIWGLGFGTHPVWGTGIRINYFVYSNNAYQDFSSNEISGFNLNTWGFAGITKAGSTLTFYFNGQAVGTSTLSFQSNSNSVLSIGCRQSSKDVWVEFLNGKVDDVRIYNRNLSDTEISALYHESISGINLFSDQNSTRIYPNPARGEINIDFGDQFQAMKGYTLKIINLSGQMVYMTSINKQILNLNLNNRNGIYFIHLFDSQNNIVKSGKIVLQ